MLVDLRYLSPSRVVFVIVCLFVCFVMRDRSAAVFRMRSKGKNVPKQPSLSQLYLPNIGIHVW